MSLEILFVLAMTSLGAATVNGALGYGYSSISVPIGLLVTTSRILNPALVVIEVVVNLYALAINWRSVPRVIKRVAPLSIGLVPGVIAGAFLLDYIAAADAKLVAFGVLLPLILVQASGKRFPIRNERRASVPLGAGVGLLYGVTTISGPPLALFWNNQGLEKNDFKTALAVVRSIESLCALAAYSYLGLLTAESASILPWIAPGVLIGFPVGHWLVRRVGVETFRRVCMSFDAYLVAFGLARTLIAFGVAPILAYQLLLITAVIDGRLLFVYFKPPADKAVDRTPALV
ncbi:MAG TPA: sulfite exporter TauE/SafE family protein [Kofleriaceae bacterium]